MTHAAASPYLLLEAATRTTLRWLRVRDSSLSALLRERLSPKRRRFLRYEGFDDLRASPRHRARSRREPDTDLFVLAPHDLAAGFQAIEFDDELKGIGHIDSAFNPQMCPGSGEIAHSAGERGETIVEGDDPRLKDTAARHPRRILSGQNHAKFGIRSCHRVLSSYVVQFSFHEVDQP